MELRVLEYFLAVAREQNITAAAEFLKYGRDNQKRTIPGTDGFRPWAPPEYEGEAGQGPHEFRIFCRSVGVHRTEQSTGIIV